MENQTFFHNETGYVNLRLRYDHMRRDVQENFSNVLLNSVKDALNSGQIREHSSGKFSTHAHFSHALTRCQILDDSGTVLATGYSFCLGSHQSLIDLSTRSGDQFRKDRGRGQAYKRALMLLKLQHGFYNDEQKQKRTTEIS